MDRYHPNAACGCMRCRCRHYMAPAILVTLGVLFLLDTMGVPGADFHTTWPVILVVIGAVLVLQHSARTEGHFNREEGPTEPPSGPPATNSGESTPPDGQVNHG